MSNSGQAITDTIAALPAAGGVVDATGLDTALTINVDPFANVTKPVTVIFGPGTTILTVNSTVPANVSLRFVQGAKLLVGAGATLSVRGSIDAPLTQIFAVDGTLDLSQALIPILYVEWFPGADLGAKISAADTALGIGTGTIQARPNLPATTDFTVSTSHHLDLLPGTYTWNATASVSSGSAITGYGCSYISGKGTILVRTTGTKTMIQAVGVYNALPGGHVNNFLISDIGLDGGGFAGQGVFINNADSFRIRSVALRHGGAAYGLNLFEEVWDFWITDSSFTNWGALATAIPIVRLQSASTHVVTDGHWGNCQFGEFGNMPIMTSDVGTILQTFISCKFHHTGNQMPFMLMWGAYRSTFHGCSFQDTVSTAAYLILIGNAATTFTDSVFLASVNSDAIQMAGNDQVQLIATGNYFLGGGGAGTGVAIRALNGTTGQAAMTITGNHFENWAAAIRNEGAAQVFWGLGNQVDISVTKPIVDTGNGVYGNVYIANPIAPARDGQSLDIGSNRGNVLLNPAPQGTINIRTGARLTQGSINDNTAGFFVITNGAASSTKTFSAEFVNPPVAVVTPLQNMTGYNWWVTTTTGTVVVHVNPVAAAELTFSYVCIGNPS